MNNLIDFLFGHPAEVFYVVLGVGVILYSCFAKRISFEGDVAVKAEDRTTYEATAKMRLYGIALGMLPLLYGLYQIINPLLTKAGPDERLTRMLRLAGGPGPDDRSQPR